MTHLPVEAEQCEVAEEALRLMDDHDVDHIPVMNGSHLRGILSRDNLIHAQLKLGADFASTKIESICQLDPLVVGPVESIDETVRKMQAQQTDCALVIDGGFVVGVFTTTDAMRFLTDFFGHA